MIVLIKARKVITGNRCTIAFDTCPLGCGSEIEDDEICIRIAATEAYYVKKQDLVNMVSTLVADKK